MTGKQRSLFRAEANALQAILQIGKGGVEENLVKQVDDALEARELIKIKALETCPDDAKTAAETLAAKTGADIIQVVGRTIVLWRKSEKLAREKEAREVREAREVKAAREAAEKQGRNAAKKDARKPGRGGKRNAAK